VLERLDALVAAGTVTGYTVEEDSAYLLALVPTLTYRMYTDDPESHRNLGEFAATMADLGAAEMRLSRVHGAVAAGGGSIRRTRQLCLRAEFADQAALELALEIVRCRFVAAPEAAPGSWHYPDLRVAGSAAAGTASVHAHRWWLEDRSAVALTLDANPPLAGATSHRVWVLPSWLGYLARVELTPNPSALVLA
jgi:ligand-binding sensor domain-containing protein